MVNYSNITKNELISVCKSRNIKNISNKKKEELIKIVKKGGYNSTKLKTFEKLLLILYDNNESKDINLNYREINYLNLIRCILEQDEISEEIYTKIDEIEDIEVKIYIYFFVNFTNGIIKNNIDTIKNLPSLKSKKNFLSLLSFSKEFNNIRDLQYNRDEINKFFDKLSKLTKEQKKCFQYIIDIYTNKKFNELDLNQFQEKNFNFNFNIGMLTPFYLSIYGNFYEKFIEKCGGNDNYKKDLINYKPKTDELSLNSLGFAIFVGNYEAVKYLLDNGADFRNVFNSRFVKDHILNFKYSQDAITFTLLLYYSIIRDEDSSIILSRLMYYQPINNSINIQNRNREIKNQKIKFIKKVINLILPKFEEKSNVNLLGYKDKDGYTPRTLLKKHFLKNKKSIDIIETLRNNNNLPQLVKNNINNFYKKINIQKKKIKNNKYLIKKIKIPSIFKRKKSNDSTGERESLLHYENSVQSGGGLSLDIGISFGLLASGALGLVFGCTVATFGLCFIIVLTVTLTSFTLYSGYKGYKGYKEYLKEEQELIEVKKQEYIDKINKYLDNSIDKESSDYLKTLTLDEMNIDIELKIIKTNNNLKNIKNNSKFMNKFSYKLYGPGFKDTKINQLIQNLIPILHNSIAIRQDALKYLKNDVNFNNILNKFGEGKVFTGNKQGFLVTKARENIGQLGRAYDFYISLYIYLKSQIERKQKISLMKCYLILNLKYFPNSLFNYNRKLYDDMKLYLDNKKKINITQNLKLNYTEVNVIKDLIDFYNISNKKKQNINYWIKEIRENKINELLNIEINKEDCKKIYEILNSNSKTKTDDIINIIKNELLLKKKLIQDFIIYFVDENINKNFPYNLKTDEYKYYITEFKDNKNIDINKNVSHLSKSEYLLNKYSDLREKSVTYSRWSNILYLLYKNKQMKFIEFIIKNNIPKMYFKELDLKYENNNKNINKDFCIIENWLDKYLDKKNKPIKNTYRIYPELELGIKKSFVLKTIDYYVDLVENR